MFSTFIPVAVIGLIHGVDPGHGWPLAISISHGRRRSYSYVAGSSMVFVGIKFWFHDGHHHNHHTHSHHHGHGTTHTHEPVNPAAGLRTLAVSALVLGFAHEEEFAILGLAVGGLNPVALMTVYALAVLAALVVITLVGIGAYLAIQHRIQAALPYMTKFSAMVLIFIGMAFFTGLY